MAITKLEHLLSKYAKIQPKGRFIKKTCIKVINKTLDVSLGLKDVSYTNGVLYIKTHGALKNEIFLQKNEILKGVKEILGSDDKVSIKDIR